MLESHGLFPREELRDRAPTLWRYREALGLAAESGAVSLGEGMTPLLETPLHGRRALLKVDFLCPTGSYKDRGSTVMISKLKEWGVRRIIEDSSGNAGASIAAYAALAGIQADIFVPASTSPGKMAQIEMYGANLIQVQGSREDTTKAAFTAASNTFYASHNWSPYFLAGMKTAAYEIAEQSGWQAPDWVVTPAGGGGLLVGLYLGFVEMVEAGFITHVPRLAAVQAAACDPIFGAWSNNLDDVPAVEKGYTAAEGISVAKPVRGKPILAAIRKSNGTACTVRDEEVWTTMEALGREGLYVEPTAAAAPAACRKLFGDGIITAQERVVVMLTGSGLKATDKVVERFAERSALRA